MTDKNNKKLVERFPKIFKKKFYFECDDMSIQFIVNLKCQLKQCLINLVWKMFQKKF